MRPQDKNSRAASKPSPPLKTTATIHELVQSGDLRGVKRLLRQKPFLLNKRILPSLETPLHICVIHNRVKILEHLLDNWDRGVEMELEAKNALCETPLHVASKNGFDEVVRLLLESQGDIQARDNNYMTPLHLAVRYAMRTGDNSTVKALLENDAGRSAVDEEGMMPFDYLPKDLQNDELTKLLDEDYEETTGEGDEDGESDRYGTGDEELDEAKSDSCDVTDDYNRSDDRDGSNEIDVERKLEEFEEELAKIVGLGGLKMQLRRWANGMILDEKRRATGIDLGPRKRPHMAFLGNPGTGKTTVARILGQLLCSVGVLSETKVTEVQRTDLIGEYIGQTGPKTRAKIEEAMGGILFVDEAYRLVPDTKSSLGSLDYGVEALEEIMSVLEDGDIVVIFGGYTEPMRRVLASNPGFCRRVAHSFQFDDFTCEDLAEMLMLKMSKQDKKSRLYGFKLHESCNYENVLRVIEENSSRELRSKMNGGLVDHMLNNARESLDSRLSTKSKGEELFTIVLGDLEAGLRVLAERTKLA